MKSETEQIDHAINELYYYMFISELRLMNATALYPDITYHSLLYLNVIVYTQNCTVSFLANALQVSKSAVTIKINELIRQGWVKKTQSTVDKRINYLTVDEQFEEEYKVYDLILNRVQDALQANYSKQEISTFCKMLQVVSKCYIQEDETDEAHKRIGKKV